MCCNDERLDALERKCEDLEVQLASESAPTIKVAKKTIPVSCIDASINADGTIAGETGYALFSATSSVSNGTGNNFGPGNRYTVSWGGPAKNDFSVLLKPKNAAGSNNGLIDHEVSRTGNSVTFVFRSGDDGGGVDESIRTDFDIIVTGGSCDVVTDVSVGE